MCQHMQHMQAGYPGAYAGARKATQSTQQQARATARTADRAWRLWFAGRERKVGCTEQLDTRAKTSAAPPPRPQRHVVGTRPSGASTLSTWRITVPLRKETHAAPPSPQSPPKCGCPPIGSACRPWPWQPRKGAACRRMCGCGRSAAVECTHRAALKRPNQCRHRIVQAPPVGRRPRGCLKTHEALESGCHGGASGVRMSTPVQHQAPLRTGPKKLLVRRRRMCPQCGDGSTAPHRTAPLCTPPRCAVVPPGATISPVL